MIFAVPGLCGAQRPLHYIKRLYVNERLKRPLGYSPVKSKVLFSGRSHVNMSLRRFRLGGGRVPFFFLLAILRFFPFSYEFQDCQFLQKLKIVETLIEIGLNL